MEVQEGIDQLAVHLTGGSDNLTPSASLGGAPADAEYRELSAIYTGPIPGLQILQVFGTCGEGEATLAVDGDGSLVFTPPGGSPGSAVAIAAGETKLVVDSLEDSGVKVYRESSTQAFVGTMTLTLRSRLNGVLAMNSVEDADRQAGITTYRCIMLTHRGDSGAADIEDLLLSVSGDDLQSTYQLGVETPDSIGEVQTISDETVEPDGIVWEDAQGSGGGLVIASMVPGESVGVWIKRTFPSSGVVSAKEEATLTIDVQGSGNLFSHVLKDFYRVADLSLERYELYAGEDELPDYEASDQPVATSVTLPFEWEPPLPASGSIVFYLVVRKRNRFNLLSFNQFAFRREVDAVGEALLGPMTAPTVEVHPAENSQVVVLASYSPEVDQDEADGWKVWVKEGSPPDPSVDTPDYTGTMSEMNVGAQKLRQALGDFASGVTVYVIVAVTRSADDEEQQAAVVTVTMPTEVDLAPEDAEIL